ncbi:MAG: STAS domain-containing protein [Terriglobia bacterium]|jgi:anti-anti-sigma factor
MRIHLVDTPNGYEFFPQQEPNAGLSCHMVRGTAVIDLRGPLAEERSVHALYDAIRELLEEGAGNFAINLAQVSGADSYTLGALGGAYNLVRQAGGRIKFFAAPERLIRGLRKFHLDCVLELYANEALALSNLQ